MRSVNYTALQRLIANENKPSLSRNLVYVCSSTLQRGGDGELGAGLTHRSVSIDPLAQPVGSQLCESEEERDVSQHS